MKIEFWKCLQTKSKELHANARETLDYIEWDKLIWCQNGVNIYYDFFIFRNSSGYNIIGHENADTNVPYAITAKGRRIMCFNFWLKT